MKEPQKELNGNLRTLVCCGRSGSTALLHCLSQSDQIDARYQLIKTSVRDAVKSGVLLAEEREDGIYAEDHSIFRGQSEKVIILKETIGSYNIPECDYSVFPREDRDDAIRVTRPVFLVRDPLEVMDAKKRRGWKSSLENSVRAYANVFREYQHAKTISPESVISCTYQHLMSKPEEALGRICNHWQIKFEDVMLDWRYPFPSSIKGGQDFYDLTSSGAFDGISKSTTLKQKEYQGLTLDIASILRLTRSDLREIYEYYDVMKADADTDFWKTTVS